MSTFFDADQFEASLDQQGPIIHLFGSDWECPADIPADVEWRRAKAMSAALKLMREGKLDDLAQLDDDAELPPEVAEQLEAMTGLDGEELYRAYIGAENLQAWREFGVTKKVLNEILRRLIAYHEGQNPEGNREARRAKKTTSPAG